ncbi:MAG: mersacidin/lichenicidin family type 2 lantibiotic [Acidobacteria bacterium]|nr:mersacidin/lichenicidin family type 2 lantibiotic [Acidobacteriota bacterium]
MKSEEIVRSWKDEDYLQSLGEAERKLLPDNPAGLIELNDDELDAVTGGEIAPTVCFCTYDLLCSSIDYLPCSIFGCPSFLGRICFPAG